MVKDRGTGKVKLTCRNWECGVIMPAPIAGSSSQEERPAIGEQARMLDVFSGTVPIPVQVPAPKHGSDGGVDRPWFFQDHF